MGEVTITVTHHWTLAEVRGSFGPFADKPHSPHGYLMSGDYQPYCEDCVAFASWMLLFVVCSTLGNGSFTNVFMGMGFIVFIGCLVHRVSLLARMFFII